MVGLGFFLPASPFWGGYAMEEVLHLQRGACISQHWGFFFGGGHPLGGISCSQSRCLSQSPYLREDVVEGGARIFGLLRNRTSGSE